MLSFLTDKTYAYIPTFQDERQGRDPQKSGILKSKPGQHFNKSNNHVSYLTTVNSLFPSACALKQGGGGTRLSLTWARLLNSKPLAHGSSSSCDKSCDSNSSHKQNVSTVQGKLQALSTRKRDKPGTVPQKAGRLVGMHTGSANRARCHSESDTANIQTMDILAQLEGSVIERAHIGLCQRAERPQCTE